MLVRGEPDPDMTFQGQGCCRSCGQAVDDNYIIVRRARPSVPGKNEFTCPRRKVRYCTCRAGKQRFIGDYSSTTAAKLKYPHPIPRRICNPPERGVRFGLVW